MSFLIALTDQRVQREQMPFDHPSLRVPNGSFPDGTDAFIDIGPVGRNGRAAAQELKPFLNADHFGANPVAGDTDSFGDVSCLPDFEQP